MKLVETRKDILYLQDKMIDIMDQKDTSPNRNREKDRYSQKAEMTQKKVVDMKEISISNHTRFN